MNNATPALEIREKDLRLNGESLQQLLKYIPIFSVKKIVDVRYGLGGWACICRDRFPKATIFGYEQDKETARQAWKDKRVKLYNKEFLASKTISCDLLLADFNLLTLLSCNPLESIMEVVNSHYLIFTDVASNKLHLNYLSYGLTKPNLDLYWTKWNIFGYKFVTYSSCHHAASSALFIRDLNKKPRNKNSGVG
jgi:hypothetical protein